MNIFRLGFELFALYLLYKLIFDFIIPVAKTTREVKKQFGSMNEKMNQFGQEQNKQYSATTPDAGPKKARADDYIEFEEIK